MTGLVALFLGGCFLLGLFVAMLVDDDDDDDDDEPGDPIPCWH